MKNSNKNADRATTQGNHQVPNWLLAFTLKMLRTNAKPKPIFNALDCAVSRSASRRWQSDKAGANSRSTSHRVEMSL